jgi:heme/copper-type cytochrome/quinol oxidase subunit 2
LPALPSIYFVGVSLLAGALADAYEFAAHNDREQAHGATSLMVAVGFVVTMLFLFVNFVLFVFYIIETGKPQAIVSAWEVRAAFLALLAAAAIGFSFKAVAESAK